MAMTLFQYKGGAPMKNIVKGILAAVLLAALLAPKAAVFAAADAGVGVVSVFTADDIQKMGARSVEDLLKRTPGYWPSLSIAGDSIGSRGLNLDVNDNYLLLIDGHKVNSFLIGGPSNEHTLPLLDKAARVEITRTPAGVSLGDGAVFGAINIITKPEGAEKGNAVSATYSGRDRRYDANLLSEGALGATGNYLFSGTYFDSRGWAEEGGSPNVLHIWNADDTGLRRWRELNPGNELFGKVSMGEVTFMARELYWSSKADNNPGYLQDGIDINQRSSFAEVSDKKKIGETGALDLRLFTGKRVTEDQLGKITTKEFAYSFDERFFGGEAVLSGTLLKNHLTAGVGATSIVGDPATNIPLSSTHVVVLGTGINPFLDKYRKSSRSFVYGEDRFQVLEKTVLLLGGRVENNTLITRKNKTMNAGIVQSIGDQWTAKYVFNGGFLSPDTTQGRNMQGVDRATKPQTVHSQDVQVSYDGAATHGSLTMFMNRTKHMIVSTFATAASWPFTGYTNLDGSIATRGVELELRKNMGIVAVYGAYSYALAKTGLDSEGRFNPNSKGWLGMPHQIYNLGADVSLPKNLSLNVNVRGWRDATVDAYFDTITPLRGEVVTDANLLWDKILGSPASASVFATNLLNANGRTPNQQIDGGWIREQGRTFGAKASYKF